jgi:hypothetical protein
MLATNCLLGPLLLTVVANGSAAVEVRGDTDCPTARDVDTALAGLIKTPVPPTASDIVRLTERDGAIRVELLTSAGELIGEKHLPASLSCADRAQTAAVVVAAWEVHLHPALQPLFLPAASTPTGAPHPIPASPETPSPTPARPVQLATRVVQQPPTQSPVNEPASPTLAFAVPTAAATPRATDRDANIVTAHAQAPLPAPIEVRTGLGLLASATAGGVSPAAELDVMLSRQGSRFGLGFGALGVGAHATTVGIGSGTWRRFGGIIDVRSRSRWRAVEIEVRGGATLTALEIAGRSLPVTSGETLLDPGILAGVRSRFRLGRLSPWIEATAVFWPRSHGLYVDGTSTAVEMSPFEALLGVGLAFGPQD